MESEEMQQVRIQEAFSSEDENDAKESLGSRLVKKFSQLFGN